MENKPWSAVVGHRSAATFNRWASRCGVEADYRGITHPSLPNYLAATGGTTAGISSDCSPGPGCTAPGSGIFGQVTAAGGRWASYVESMPANCATAPAGDYAVKHNPAAYYPGLRAACTAQDVPLGRPEAGPLAQALAAGTLPTFSFVTPNMCDDTHDCPVAVGDSWLDRWLRVIVGSPTYRQGGLAVFVTWDEDDRSAGNHVPLLVIAPSVPAGAVVTQAATHYSLLRTTEDMLGLPPLGHAADATSMRSAFHL
jgi:phospholipase C